ncbi:MAG: hypothetical protein SGILL_003374 [Bacillariaceae sp.]
MTSPQALKKNRRPPKDPSAATAQPKNALERQAMQSHAFRQKVAGANSITICNASSNKVGRMPLRELLQSDKFCVPIFQRRYCWTEAQWQTLLDDAVATISPNASSDATTRYAQGLHSLGRLTCTNIDDSSSNNDEDNDKRASSSSRNLMGLTLAGRSCILDGQQRFTTVTILLAAIRDLLQEYSNNENDGNKDNSITASINLITQILFLDPIQMGAWIHNPNEQLEEGIELDFARLVPTFCDRMPYFAAVLPQCSKATQSTILTTDTIPSSWQRPLVAKAFFLKTLRNRFPTSQELNRILAAMLDRLSMLYFPVNVNHGKDDGTEDLMVIYERLALRDATFCKPTRAEEYQSMDGVDMIRNLLLGCFDKPDDALNFYKDYWLPLERLSEEKKTSVKELVAAFLEEQEEEGDASNDAPRIVKIGTIGGQTYAEFQEWFTEQQSQAESVGTNENELVRSVGKDLLQFASNL